MIRLTVREVLTLLLIIIQISGCTQLKPRKFEQVSDALTPGIFWEQKEAETTRKLIPEGTKLKPVYPKGITLTKESEGFRRYLYNDSAGYCTIGYGHLIKKEMCDGSEEAEFLEGISEPKGESLLIGDMDWAKYTVLSSVKIDLTPGQYAALVDFVFNVGSGNFRRSTLYQKVKSGQHDQVPSQFMRWVKAGGKIWPGLVTRRRREIDLYLEGSAIPRLLPEAGKELPQIDIREGESN